MTNPVEKLVTKTLYTRPAIALGNCIVKAGQLQMKLKSRKTK